MSCRIVVAKHNLDESFDKIQKCRILFGDSDSTNEGLKQYFDKDQTDCGIHLFFKLMCHFAAAYKVAAAELAQWDLDDERKVCVPTYAFIVITLYIKILLSVDVL